MIRRPMLRNALIILALALTLSAAPARRRSVFIPPYPLCSMVTGTPAVTFTRDNGRTLAPRAEALTGIGYTYGLAALDTPHTLLAWHKSDLVISSDAGCSWRVVATFTDWDFPPKIEPARGGRAYAWSDNRQYMIRYDARGATKLKPPAAFVGVGVNPSNGEHLRAGGNDGSLWESTDGGETWAQIGSVGSASAIFYRITFDPSDLDHIVAGTAIDGAFFTRDGGRTWSRSSGLGSGAVNVFNIVISPAAGQVVWAMGINLSDGRHIYRSTDGGATFRPVVDEAPGINLVNGPVMAAHPADPNRLYFVFGTRFDGYGTDLFHYDAGSNTLTVAHNDHHDVNAIAFASADPRVLYLGLETEIGVR